MIEVLETVRKAYGELPPGWELEKLKFFADIRNSNVDKTISEDENAVWLCNYTDIYYNDRITSDLNFMEGSATATEIERFQLKGTSKNRRTPLASHPPTMRKPVPEKACMGSASLPVGYKGDFSRCP